jgi:hypothetical protein
LVYQDIGSRGAGLSFRFVDKLEKEQKEGENSVLEKIVNAKKNEAENLTKAYIEALERGEYSRTLLKKIKKRGTMLILWKKKGKKKDRWKKMFVYGGAGDLAEAYLYFYMDKDRIENFKSEDLETNIDIFMTKGVTLVDNIRGLLKGDFEVDGINYAAKSQKASMMGYRQVIDMALQISKLGEEEIKNLMKKENEKIIE